MTQDTWDQLESLFQQHPILKAEGVSRDGVPLEEIDAASAMLGVTFDADYREFVRRYGGATVGPYSILGLRRSETMGNGETVVEATNHFRDDGWRGVEGWYIISIDHAGNPIGMDADGRVWLSDHDFGDVVCIALRFEEHLRKCLQK